MKSMSRAKVFGALLNGLGLAIEIAPLRSSRSEILKVYDELPAAHKKQGSKFKNQSNHKNDNFYKIRKSIKNGFW